MKTARFIGEIGFPFLLRAFGWGYCQPTDASLTAGEQYRLIVDIVNTWISPLYVVEVYLHHSGGDVEVVVPTTRLSPFGSIHKDITTNAGPYSGSERIEATVRRLFSRGRVECTAGYVE